MWERRVISARSRCRQTSGTWHSKWRRRDNEFDLWVMDIARGVASRVTSASGTERDPVWARDGRSLAFIARTAKGPSLRLKGLRASDPERVIQAGAGPDEYMPETWIPNGDTLLVTRRNPRTNRPSGLCR